jgi:hypothetical protein
MPECVAVAQTITQGPVESDHCGKETLVCRASARDRWWKARRVGPWACRVSGGPQWVKAAHARSQREASLSSS